MNYESFTVLTPAIYQSYKVYELSTDSYTVFHFFVSLIIAVWLIIPTEWKIENLPLHVAVRPMGLMILY